MADGPNERRGRTEAFLNGKWGTICDKGFSMRFWPRIFCIYMGYKTITQAPYARNTAEGQGTGNIAWPGISCAESLEDCLHNTAPCGHYHDVVVACTDTP